MGTALCRWRLISTCRQRIAVVPSVSPHWKMSRMTVPRNLGNVLSRLMARTGYDREQGSDALRTAWERVAPESLRGGSQAGVVRRGVLEVFVTHSALVQEMGFHKHEVIQKLQSLLPSEGITDIRCRLLIEAGQK